MKSIQIILLAIFILPFIFFSCNKDTLTNDPPEIINLSADPGNVLFNENSVIICSAIDVNEDELLYEWEVTGGTFIGDDSTIIWTAPGTPGNYTISCTVSDEFYGFRSEDTESVTIEVTQFPSTTTELIAYYPFNGNANDESGNGNDGIVLGPSLTSDRFGNQDNAYYFHGGVDRINMGNNVKPSFPISVSIWVKPVFYDSIEVVTLFNNDSFDHCNYYNGVKFSLFNDGDLFGTVGSGYASGWSRYSLITTSAPIINESWTFITVVFDKNKLIKLYVNREEYFGTPGSGSGYSMTKSNANGFIGNRYGCGEWFQGFIGSIDEIRVYNRILTPPEIQNLYLESGKDSM